MPQQPVHGPNEARPGQSTCLNRNCPHFNKRALGSLCPGCAGRTAIRPVPDLFQSLGYPAAPPRPAQPPRPTPPSPGTALSDHLGYTTPRPPGTPGGPAGRT